MDLLLELLLDLLLELLLVLLLLLLLHVFNHVRIGGRASSMDPLIQIFYFDPYFHNEMMNKPIQRN